MRTASRYKKIEQPSELSCSVNFPHAYIKETPLFLTNECRQNVEIVSASCLDRKTDQRNVFFIPARAELSA